tara:strand:+ start:10 stop:333 length:324 start_codon:yes stop_codon:yes gene_type:complete
MIMAYDNKKEFALGLFFHETELTKDIQTNEKQFIFFKVGIKKKELIAYLESKLSEDDWINIDIKRSRENKFYGEVNTYKPKTEDKPESNSDSNSDSNAYALKDEIPF